jgi:hypothetical protein
MNPAELSLFLVLVGALVVIAIIASDDDDDDPHFL